MVAQRSSPDIFLPYLEEHPEDEDHRVAALVWYFRRERDAEMLKKHTFEMIKYHPDNMYIHFENRWLFLSDSTYRSNAIAELEAKVAEGHQTPDIHWTLAEIYSTGAVPAHDGTPEGRAKCLKWYGLPDDAVLVTDVHPELVAKTLRHFGRAIELANDRRDPFHVGLYSQQAAKFLIKANEPAEALDVCRDALQRLRTLKAKRDETQMLQKLKIELKGMIGEIQGGPTR